MIYGHQSGLVYGLLRLFVQNKTNLKRSDYEDEQTVIGSRYICAAGRNLLRGSAGLEPDDVGSNSRRRTSRNCIPSRNSKSGSN